MNYNKKLLIIKFSRLVYLKLLLGIVISQLSAKVTYEVYQQFEHVQINKKIVTGYDAPQQNFI